MGKKKKMEPPEHKDEYIHHYSALIRLGAKEYTRQGGLDLIEDDEVREYIGELIQRSRRRVKEK